MVDLEGIDVPNGIEHVSCILESSGPGADQVVSASKESYWDLANLLDVDIIRVEVGGFPHEIRNELLETFSIVVLAPVQDCLD